MMILMLVMRSETWRTVWINSSQLFVCVRVDGAMMMMVVVAWEVAQEIGNRSRIVAKDIFTEEMVIITAAKDITQRN